MAHHSDHEEVKGDTPTIQRFFEKVRSKLLYYGVVAVSTLEMLHGIRRCRRQKKSSKLHSVLTLFAKQIVLDFGSAKNYLCDLVLYLYTL